MLDLDESIAIVRVDPPAIVERDTNRADFILKRAKELGGTIAFSTFEFAKILSEIKKNDFWAVAKCESWEDFIKKSDFDLSPRQAYYLVQINDTSVALGIPLQQLAAAKISKLKEIFTLDPNTNVFDEATQKEESMADIIRDLVRRAPGLTLSEVKEIVKRLKGQTEDEDSQLTWMNLPVRRDAKNVVLRAIDLARLLSGDTIDAVTEEVKNISNAMALERIAADFLSDPNNVAEDIGEAGTFDDSSEDEDRDIQYDDEHDSFDGNSPLFPSYGDLED